MNKSLETHRQNFPALENKAYFNYGGQGPLPQVSMDKIIKSYQFVQECGPFSQKVNSWVQQELGLTREAIASELGVPSATITLTEDVTVGCNIALWGIDWQRGDHLLISDCEHPGVVATVGELVRRFQIEVSVCPLLETLNEGDPVEAIASRIKSNTRLVVISHILWNTGQVLPLTAIMQACKAASGGVRVLVDAAQSVGVLPLNLGESGVDFYGFTGHKWLCGPEGLGGLYVSPDAVSDLSPTFIGWRGIEVDERGTPTNWKSDGRRYEIATSAYPLMVGLREAIAIHNQWGTATERYQQICNLSQYLWERLSELPQIDCLRTSPPESGLVSFKVTQSLPHPQIVRALESENILVRTILDPDCIRACVHYFTQRSEIDELISCLAKISGGG